MEHYIWNKNSTVIKFEPESSLAYNSNYEIRISKETKDRASMTIDTLACACIGDDYCSYFISTIDDPESEKEDPTTNHNIQNTGFFNYYWPKYNLSNWSGYSNNQYNPSYWSGYSMGKSLLKIPNNNFNLPYKVDRYSNYQLMGNLQLQSFPYTNFNTWDFFSPAYNNYSSFNLNNFNNYIKNIYQTYGGSLQGLNNYSNCYQNR